MANEGRKAVVPVAFGEPGEEAVLGVTALEILGLVVDPVGQKLIPRNLLLLSSTSHGDLIELHARLIRGCRNSGILRFRYEEITYL